MRDPVKYTVIVPVYNEEEVIAHTYARLRETMDTLGEPYELLFVNDGSRDKTASILEGICAEDPRVRLLDFSRNFGHQIAITAGMDHARGDAVVIIDADLQDPPKVILEMIDKWKQGYEVVYGKRLKRKGETLFKKVTAMLFYRFLRSMTSVDIPVDTGDFRLMDRKVVDVMRGLKEKNRFVRGLVSWVGFRQTAVEYVREERFAGETKYPLRKMIKFALDAITSFSFKPLRLATYFGFALSSVSFLYLLVVLYERLFTTTQPGWASIVAINLLFNGIMLIMLGIVGEYVGRIYEESKNRPLYILRREIGPARTEEEKAEHEREPAVR
ncbi:glycosyltransferase family 2 protein [Paenibacillus thermoaerophilus]|uniref:Glycosyltransferase family 2 protein n=1 Tax=Paenibacillus thermoaerophilus TaxID=1215385 RepID=A0ABW2V3K8_9BACL|nr:glycosyltransferase family 2 protein [Paenibacillus thermoaerophilus]TMV17768.1 glycosyltransferase family 2 protein [Paenibacillus thermoaerophilus]